MPTPKGRYFARDRSLFKLGDLLKTVFCLFFLLYCFSFLRNGSKMANPSPSAIIENDLLEGGKEEDSTNAFSLQKASEIIMEYEQSAGSVILNAEKMLAEEANYLGNTIRNLGSKGVDSLLHGGSHTVRGKHLVIGMAKDLEPLQLVVFVGSLRQYCKSLSTDIVIFLNEPIEPRVKEIMEMYEVIFIPFHEEKLEPKQLRNFHPSTIRWPLIYEYIRQSSEKGVFWDAILMADVRDTAFQMDPFATIIYDQPVTQQVLYDTKDITYFDYDSIQYTPTTGFYTFNGVEDKKIIDCGWNGGWVKSCFGQDMLKKVGPNNIICSGISIGTYDEVLSYLTKMTKTILDLDNESPISFQTCERNGVDQGVHNVLVHTKQIPKLVLKSQRHGLVCNLQSRIADVKPFKVISPSDLLKKKGIQKGLEVRSPLGHLYAIVHQYDRNAELTKYYFDIFRYWDDTEEAEEACKNFNFHFDVDYFKGRCDLGMKGGVPNESSCCNGCNTNPKCKAFTFVDGKCFYKDCNDLPTSSTRWSKKGALTGVLR